MEIDKGSCRYFYRPDNTYSVNFWVEIQNTSTAGEILRNIQVRDVLSTTFGNPSRIISASVTGLWGGQGATTQPWNWDWTNTNTWNGTTNTNLFNNGTNTLANLWLYPGGYIHVEMTAIVRASNLGVGIGSNNNWTNTATFISAQTTTGVNLTTANVANTLTPAITNAITVSPRRSRSIITSGVIVGQTPPPTDGVATPPVALDGTHTYSYYIKLKHHPNVVANPDGAHGTATNLSSYFDISWYSQNYNVPYVSISATKVYGPASLTVVSGYNGGLSLVNGISVTPQARFLSGNMAINDSVLVRVSVVVGPTNNKEIMWNSNWTDFNDAGGVYQELPSGNQDTLNDPYAQNNCYGYGVQLISNTGINLTKSVISTSCVTTPGILNNMDVTYEFNISAPSTNNVWMRNLELQDSLFFQSCGSFQGIVSAPSIIASTATTNPTINPSFNGNTVTNLFNPSINDKLAPNQFIRVRTTARYYVPSMCTPNHTNIAKALGRHPAGESTFQFSPSVTVTKLNCCTMTSTLGSPFTVCPGNSITLTPNMTNGTPNYSYTWNNGLGSTAPHTVSPAANTTYQVTVTDAANCTATTSITVTVVNDPIVTASGAANVCTGGTTSLSAFVVGGSGTNTFQWQRRLSPSGAWTNVGSNSATYVTDGGLAANNYDYQVILTQSASGCAATSAIVSANVAADPTASITSSAASICVGGATTLNATSSGGTGTCTFQWQSSANNSTWTNISGATANTYTTPALNTPTYYRVVYQCSANGCCD